MKGRFAEESIGRCSRGRPSRSSSFEKLSTDHPTPSNSDRAFAKSSSDARRPRSLVKAITTKFEDITRPPSRRPEKSSHSLHHKSSVLSEYTETPLETVRQAKSSSPLSAGTTPTERETFKVASKEVAHRRRYRLSFREKPQKPDGLVERHPSPIDRQLSPLDRNMSPREVIMMCNPPGVLSGTSQIRLVEPESPSPTLTRDDSSVASSIPPVTLGALGLPSYSPKGKGKQRLECPPTDVHSSPPKPLRSPPSLGPNTNLHFIIRRLQRDLDFNKEEAIQLRRLAVVNDDRDVETLGEGIARLRQERDGWRTRAQAAERQLGVFEKLTRRIRSIGASFQEMRDANLVAAAAVGQADGDVDSPRSLSPSSRPTHDREVSQSRHRLEFSSSRISSRGNETESNISAGAAQVWMAAQEILRFDDEEQQS